MFILIYYLVYIILFTHVTKNLSKSYSKGVIKAVDALNLKVYEGETFGLLGPNGAGKTTAVRLLNCIKEQSEGTATVNGFDILTQRDKVKRITGMLAESPGLYEKLSSHTHVTKYHTHT